MHDKAKLNFIHHAKEVLPFMFYHASEWCKQAMGFLEKVNNYHRLCEKIRIANNDSDVVEIAMQSGFTFSTDEICIYEDHTFKRKIGIRGWYTS